MHTILKTAVSASALAFAAVSANAATYTFDFASLGSNHSSLYVESNEDSNEGVTVTGSYYSIDNGNFLAGDDIDVDTNSWGLISNNSRSDSHTIDSKGTDEAMVFTFDNIDVTMNSIDISWYEGTGDYDLFTDGVHQGHTSTETVLPAGPASSFAVGTRTITNCSYIAGRHGGNQCSPDESGIKIGSITIDYTPENVQAVPLPAAGWMLFAGLGGLAAMRRRKQR